ncbi:hypothetical protein NMY22_g11219 [Coprinellus aureogranulatus]|nr:hypothetical protein NMY22_g11219 [Coprinellus aureogranulatus]
MSAHSSDIEQWARVRYAKTEVPLLQLVEDLKKDPKRYALQRRTNVFPENYVLWDTKQDHVITVTHAFLVKSTSNLDTGNFVPPKEKVPPGVSDKARKSEPHRGAQVIEEWMMKQSIINTETMDRATWMTTAWVGESNQYTVTSAIFHKHTPFNHTATDHADVKVEVPTLKYEVHPWIKKVTAPLNNDWIPNPQRVLFYERLDKKQVALSKTDIPRLRSTDLVKMVFKIAATVSTGQWSMSLSPIQIIRVARLLGELSGASDYSQDSHLDLPEEGDVLEDLLGTDNEESDDSTRTKGKGREVPFDDSEPEFDGNSPPWGSLTPESDDQELVEDHDAVSTTSQLTVILDDTPKPRGEKANKRDRGKNDVVDEPERKKRMVKPRNAK